MEQGTPVSVPVEPVSDPEPIADQMITPEPVNYNSYGSQSYGSQAEQPVYSQPAQGAASGGDYKTVCLLSLIFGGSCFLINPLYLISLAGLVLGIIGIICSQKYKTWAVIGMILSIVGCICQIIIDIFCTLGFGIFC